VLTDNAEATMDDAETMTMALPQSEPRSGKLQFSFDVFDTAVCRLIHSPEHIHLIVGRKLRNRGVIGLSDTEWMYVRAEAEFRQRLTVPHREVTLNDIYDRLSRSLNLRPADARIALETELSEELRLIRPIASTRQRVSELVSENIPAIFLSDTYFTSRQVEILLAQSGYAQPLDVIASSEALKSKIEGTIYDHVATQRGIQNSCFQHLGDNDFSDVRNARARGWNAQIFVDSRWTTRERVLFASGGGEFLSSAIAGSARAARLGQEVPVKDGILTAAASVVGPLFAAYVLWVLLDVLARGGRTIHFLARDGQIMAPICQRLARWLGANIDARYTYASRQAFLLPALPENDNEMVDQALALAYYDHISLSDAMTSLKYSDEEIKKVARNTGIELHETSGALNESRKVALRDALLREEVLDPLRARVRVARAATLAYLESEGMFASTEACIVDLGWRGNTQLRLQRIVGDRVDLTGYYMGLSNSVLGPNANTRIWTTTTPWKTGLLEVMAAADHTSVKGFGFAEDNSPVCVPPIKDDPVLIPWGARQQQAIALRFVEYLTDAVELNHFRSEEVYAALRSAAMDAYRHFRLSPTSAEAEAYGGIPHQDDVNHSKHRELAQAVTSLDIARHIFDRRAKSEISSWYMGSIARSKDRLPLLVSRSIDQTLKLMARVETKRKKRASHRLRQASLRDRMKKDE
jgi:FMN phosphatase YigB (HAD superfamily)